MIQHFFLNKKGLNPLRLLSKDSIDPPLSSTCTRMVFHTMTNSFPQQSLLFHNFSVCFSSAILLRKKKDIKGQQVGDSSAEELRLVATDTAEVNRLWI